VRPELPQADVRVLGAASRAVSRIRNRAIWSLALFCAIVPVVFVTEPSGHSLEDPAAVGLLGSLFWLSAATMAMLAGWHCLRNWSIVPGHVKVLGLAPAVCAAIVGLLLLASNAIPS